MHLLDERSRDIIDKAVLKTWFAQYEDPDCSGKMLVEGIVKFCEEIGENTQHLIAEPLLVILMYKDIDPEDPVMLVLSEYMKAETMLEYTKEEFFRGMQKLR